MPKNEANAKSERKPLRNVSNNDVRRSSKSAHLKIIMSEKHNPKEVNEDDALDHLLLLQSDISSILHQIDELVVQAFKLKTASKEGRREIKCFSLVLSDMLSSLKPWADRFQRVLSKSSDETENQPQQALVKKPVVRDDRDDNDSPEEPKFDSLVSPSPLVSWRANCTIERGRQMFMLTPLPKSKAALSSKRQEPSKSEFNRLSSSTNAIGTSAIFTLSRDMPDCLFDTAVINPTPMKPSASVAIEGTNARGSSMIVMTPCLKMSPPKSCVLLEPISEISHVGHNKFRKSTPFPVGIHYSDSESESSDENASQGLALKYPELLGIHQISKSCVGKKTMEASPYCFTSPLKTCVLLNPPDEKSMDLEKGDNDSCVQTTDATVNQQTSKLEADVLKDHDQTKKSYNQESTPMWHEPQSSFPTGKGPGETTLKKELWTKFEAASTTNGTLLNFPTSCKTTQKGFLDLLEEASCDD